MAVVWWLPRILHAHFPYIAFFFAARVKDAVLITHVRPLFEKSFSVLVFVEASEDLLLHCTASARLSASDPRLHAARPLLAD